MVRLPRASDFGHCRADVLLADRVASAEEEEPQPTKIVSIKMSDGVTLQAALYLPAQSRKISDALRRVALPFRQQRSSRLSRLPVARNWPDRLVSETGLRFRPSRRARHRSFAG